MTDQKDQRVVVVGGGLAAGTFVTALREEGFDGSVTLVTAEEHVPYERPPLSKDYLMGSSAFDDALVHDSDWYAAHDVTVRTGERVVAIDRDARVVRTDTEGSEGEVPYDVLVLATGATPRHLAIADDAGVPVTYLRTVEDSDRLRAAYENLGRLTVVGGGWIGLEAAAAARQAGVEVTLFEQADLPLLAVLGPEVARVFADLHAAHGVDLRVGTAVTAADVGWAEHLLVGIGVAPVVDLAEQAGLEVDDGVLVDSRMRTSDPAVLAIGDVASVDHPVLGQRVRVEHWQTAIDHGKAAARTVLRGDEAEEMTSAPYFFTDQYDLGMEYVGFVGPEGYDQVVVRGDATVAEGQELVFTAFWLRGGRVRAAMHVNDWDATDTLRALVGREVDADALADPERSLESFVD